MCIRDRSKSWKDHACWKGESVSTVLPPGDQGSFVTNPSTSALDLNQDIGTPGTERTEESPLSTRATGHLGWYKVELPSGCSTGRVGDEKVEGRGLGAGARINFEGEPAAEDNFLARVDDEVLAACFLGDGQDAAELAAQWEEILESAPGEGRVVDTSRPAWAGAASGEFEGTNDWMSIDAPAVQSLCSQEIQMCLHSIGMIRLWKVKGIAQPFYLDLGHSSLAQLPVIVDRGAGNPVNTITVGSTCSRNLTFDRHSPAPEGCPQDKDLLMIWFRAPPVQLSAEPGKQSVLLELESSSEVPGWHVWHRDADKALNKQVLA
eukprot:TRINITY_DN13742_c0_g1_i1.p1 TRINITY_DN13742_c0_g1~~TRINITY_DN13742_c0_g1_i1.p1  ORF type:complete len:320 (+),score=42.63 TRINITY_DN13742_c0_g1_i1:101-1060(+)